jgi:hypothetical protein
MDPFKTLLLVLLQFYACLACAQIQVAAKDTLIMKDSTRYAGTIIREDIRNSKVQFMTTDSQMHFFSSSDIAHIFWAHSHAGGSAKAIDNNTVPAPKVEAKQPHTQPVRAPIYWEDPRISGEVYRKHKTGITMTTIGIGAIVLGSVLNGYGTQISGHAILIFSIASTLNIGGLPIMIVGAIKIHRSNKLARAAMTRKK